MDSEQTRILLIEDNRADARLIQEMLVEAKSSLTYRLECVDRLSKGLERLTEAGIDIVLLDLGLPDSQGLDTLQRVRDQAPDVPIVVLTGLEDEAVALRGVKDGAQDYLIKGQVKSNPLVRAVRYAIERKQAEERLRAASQQWKTTFDGIADAVCVLDKNTIILRCNEAMGKLVAKPVEEIVGRNCCEVIHGSPQHVEGCPVMRMLRSLKREVQELEVKDRWLRVTVDPIIDNEGELTGAVYIAADITERKQVKEALEKSEQIYRAAIEVADAVPYYQNYTTNTYEFVGPRIQSLIGYSPEEFSPEVWTSIAEETILLGDLAGLSIDDAVRRARGKEGVSWRADYEVRTRAGEKRWIANAAVQARDEKGKVVGSLGILQDITERKRAMEALRLDESRFQALLKLSQMSEESRQRIVDFALEETVKLTGSEVGFLGFMNEDETILRMHAWSKTATAECAIVDKPITFPIEQGSIWAEAVRQRKPLIINDYSAPNPRKNGYPQGHVELSRLVSVPVFDGNQIVALAAVGNKGKNYEESDVRQLRYLMDAMWRLLQRKRAADERESLEEQLRQSHKMEAVGKLAGGVAHDFNNLLMVINGYSKFVLDALDADDPAREDVEEIRKAGERAALLTRQLMAFSRKQILQPEILDLNTVVTDTDKMLRRLIGEDIELVTITDPNLGSVEADPVQVEQVIVNLAVNARDAMPRGGRLTIETANVDLREDYACQHHAVIPGPYAMLAMTDTGVGMDEETQSRIFEPFFTTKEIGKGTGLGLSTVYGIVKQSGGYIWVYSEPGQGTTFKVYFPRVEKGVEDVKLAVRDESLEGSETILVVEDEEAVRRLIRKTLEGKGYTVLDASNGDEALGLCNQHTDPIDLLITDVVMPGVGGRELGGLLATSHPETRVVYMSGYTGNAVVRHDVLEAGTAFLQKPIDPDALARKVREVLDKREQE